jgi:hypothetical protein
MKIALMLWVALAGSVAPALAQEQERVVRPAFEQRFDELSKWLEEYYAWERWFAQWGNRVAHNFEGRPIWKRQTRPAPPVWLEAECQGYLGTDGLLATACDILRHWETEPLAILQRGRASVVNSGGNLDDKVVKSSFFRRVHLTGLWAQAQYPGTPAYGIVGMQIGVVEVGRLTLPAVGAMVVLVPGANGGYEWTPATTIGFGYRIANVVAPLIRKQVSLHINLARTNLHGAHNDRIVPGVQAVTLFGLSVSPQRRR